MSAPAWSSRQEFTRELERPDEEMNLARAALLVAREEYVQLPVERYLLRLDLLAEETRDRLGSESVPPVVLAEAIRHLFAVRKLRGNREQYHDPRNSFLNDVLDRGLGIPLTLGMVLLEVGWRLGLPLEGVNFPGHFMVRYRGDAVTFLIDPFHGGMIRSRKEVRQILNQQRGGRPRLERRHFKTASRRDMIVRLLLNLKGIYHRAGDDTRALAAVERILVVRPTARVQIRDRGYLLARLGRADEAVTQLETYLAFAPNADDVGRVEALVQELRAGGKPLPGSS
jgi:regulator of sirC expression with transglutaminase-like and TPR domain